jgi:hypothetical protein
MLSASVSGCINHPGVEAVARCKQCGKPVCASCVVKGPTGQFCGEACKDRHEKFISRAQDLQRNSRPAGTLKKIRILLIKLVILIAALAALGYAALQFDIPVASDLVRKVLQFAAPYLGGRI